ncbi:MAG: hypothetical protein BJBARM4_0355 [Candidatus Parvarchaeum acidiphilum ARMAN-4]|uniref:Uncharacterized protein n=1 Tax=Candidatus Parvarchaeum acidiphilum ARMAN-4 TaxID=662760 RepID=D2EF45_PARA4|nr:MAG: hypothetical protein BJBARM4_0355 [Candidatus Parvarchaeum acidiphilum ARMAN-4]
MEDEAAFMYFNSIAQGFLNKTEYNIENKLYKDALSNLYKAEEWRDYFILTDPEFKKSPFAKEIQKARYELKKAVSKDKVDLDSILKSLNLKKIMSSSLELTYHKTSPVIPY